MKKERIHDVIIWLLTKIFQSTLIIHILASTLIWEQNAVSILSSIQNGSSFIDAFQSYFIPSNILNKIICYTLEKELTTILKYFTLIFSFVQVVSNLSRASLKIKFSVKTIFISSVMATSNKKYTQMSMKMVQ